METIQGWNWKLILLMVIAVEIFLLGRAIGDIFNEFWQPKIKDIEYQLDQIKDSVNQLHDTVMSIDMNTTPNKSRDDDYDY